MSLTQYMPKKPIAGYSVRAWVTKEDLERFKDLSEATGMQQSEIMTRILHAGIEALSEKRLTLPLQFTLKSEETPTDRRASRVILNDESHNNSTVGPPDDGLRYNPAQRPKAKSSH